MSDLSSWIPWMITVAALIVAGVAIRRGRNSPSPRAVVPAVDRSRVEADAAGETLDNLDEGYVLLGASQVPIVANRAARSMLDMQKALPARIPSDELASIARRSVVEHQEVEATVGLWPSGRTVRARAVPIGDEGATGLFLRDVTEELQAHQIRRQFVASASHELKTPVAGIQALAEAIQDSVGHDPQAAERFAGRLVHESERLSRLITDLLDLSRVEDPSSISLQLLDFSELVDAEIDAIALLGEQRGVSLSRSTTPDLHVRGDKGQLSLMVRNLLDNALRYTAQGGVVTVRTTDEDSEAVLMVADTGIGIPLQAQARVFERFYRVDEDRARRSGGTGLGLSIVKHVVDLHGGHVSLESELDRGSTFTIRVPLASSQAVADA